VNDSKAENNKAIVLEAFDTLFNKRDYTAAERFWSPNYIQHSAHIEVEAHGGLKRWSQLTTVKASLSITGTLWQLKGQSEALKDVVVEARLKRQQLTTHLIQSETKDVK
jgi:hypothetical protein